MNGGGKKKRVSVWVGKRTNFKASGVLLSDMLSHVSQLLYVLYKSFLPAEGSSPEGMQGGCYPSIFISIIFIR